MIPVGNIYYMLSYAFRDLRSGNLWGLGAESFDNAEELCAEILIRATESLVRHGLGRSYNTQSEPLSTIRGRINVGDTIRTQSLLRHQLICEHDSFSVNSPANQILKATLLALLRTSLSSQRKRSIRTLLPYFSEVDEKSVRSLKWNVRITRSSSSYELILFMCKLLVEGLVMADSSKSSANRLAQFLDDQTLPSLYERFILEYFRQEHPELKANAPYIDWGLTSPADAMSAALLPTMRSDVTLSQGSSKLIIDAKYYKHSLASRYGVPKLISGNLYQIFAYVKNEQHSMPAGTPPVSGMLLYARTDSEPSLDCSYNMDGNCIQVKSLDLSGSFDVTRTQLDAIAHSLIL